VLEWLYASSYDSKHKKTRRERVQGSGTWLFERQEYQDWHCPTGPHRSLWCHGGPGAGKTCITSAIVDELLSTYEAREIGLAYIYLDYADKEAQTLENVLASILKQIALCKKKEGIEEVRRLWCACKIDNRSAEAEALVETLGRMCQHFRQIFVVLDALDECSDELRKLLLKHLQALDDPKWRFFLTGRSHLSNVLPKFLSCLQVTVSAHDNDIEKAVLARIQEEADLSELFDNNPSLEEKVVSKITEMAKGMFLLVTLMLNSIASSTCESDVEESLEHMPVDLDQSYERTLKRIEDQDSKKVELSYRILWWLSRARRPLSCDELRQAIAVRDGDRGRNTKKESKKGIMIKACMGLVFIDDTGGFRLVHFSTQEYLRTHFSELTMKQKLREDHIIARACLTILSYDEFEGGPCETSEAAQKRYEKHPMLSYAADYWHEHLSGSMSGRLSVFYCVQQLLEEPDVDVNGTDDGCRTPLALAIRHDRAKVVELLLSAETIDCEHKANTGRTPLLDAVQYNHTDIVKQLLAKGVEVQVLDKEQMNGLHIAANTYYRSAQIVELLVGSGIDVNARNKKNQTPLHVTAGRGNCKAVEVLLSGGADVCAADKDGWTPL
ncbi:ankyrin, partial [Pyrenochaeta sp. DS3sAY3a]